MHGKHVFVCFARASPRASGALSALFSAERVDAEFWGAWFDCVRARQGHYGIAPRRQSRGVARRVSKRAARRRLCPFRCPHVAAHLRPLAMRLSCPRPCSSLIPGSMQARAGGSHAIVTLPCGAVWRQAAEEPGELFTQPRLRAAAAGRTRPPCFCVRHVGAPRADALLRMRRRLWRDSDTHAAP